VRFCCLYGRLGGEVARPCSETSLPFASLHSLSRKHWLCILAASVEDIGFLNSTCRAWCNRYSYELRHLHARKNPRILKQQAETRLNVDSAKLSANQGACSFAGSVSAPSHDTVNCKRCLFRASSYTFDFSTFFPLRPAKRN
jgi:hypothetical protein